MTPGSSQKPSKPIRKAVFPVAGLGTRFLPATKAMPKEMLTVVDRPVIQHVVDEARAAGIEHFIFVTGRNKGVIEDHFDSQFELEQTLSQRGKNHELELLLRDLPGPGQTSFTRQQAPLQRVLELIGHVEMVLDHALVAPGDENELLDPGGPRLVDHMLKNRAVDHSEHFLRNRLGRGKKARAKTRDGQNRFADGLVHFLGYLRARIVEDQERPELREHCQFAVRLHLL